MAFLRHHSLAFYVSLLFCLYVSTASAASAVLGIDLGTNFIKAAIVKPGTPLDIVLTKDSKRKEASVVAFKPASEGPVELGSFPERLYGGDAVAIAGRFPGDVYINLKPLLGIDPSDTALVDDFKSRYPAIKVNMKDKRSVSVSSGAFSDKEQAWTIEELLAMELKNIRANAEVMTGKGSKVVDAVITIPAFYTAQERSAVHRAADMAGLNVMGLISDGLAIGVDYSVKREFPNVSRGGKAELHLVFDMGASSTTATVLKLQSRDVKDVGKYNKTIQDVTVVGTGWDRTLGGNALNGVIFEHLLSEFSKKPEVIKAGISAKDVSSHGRTASKLWRESERARQVLSANSDVRSSFEELYEDMNFAAKLSRTQFEELAEPFASRVEGPIQQALEAAKIKVGDLTSVILHGGAIRTPFVHKKLEAIFGNAVEIRSNVNADESAAFGAAFKAATLSPSFRVKEIRDAESAIYASGITQSVSGKDKQQQVFIPTSQAGTPKQIQFKEKADFEFDLYQKVGDEVKIFQRVETKNLTAGVKALSDKFGCAADVVQTKFTLRLSPKNGLPEVVSGVLTCTVEGSAKKGGIVDSVKGLFGGKKEQEPLKEDVSSLLDDTLTSSTSSSAVSASSGAAKESSKKPAIPEIRTESITIQFTTSSQGIAIPGLEESVRMVDRLAAFDRSDKARSAREEAYNTLEGFTYRARDLLADIGFQTASTDSVRSQLTALLSSTGDWLYGEGSTSTSEVLKAKLKDFKDLIDPVQMRILETSSRPAKIKLLEKALDQTKSTINNISGEVAKAAAQASSAAAVAASSASSAVTPDSSAVKDEDDLEDDESSTATSSSAMPTTTAPLIAYTEDDVSQLQETYDSIKSWLSEQTTLQAKLKPNEDGVLSGTDLDAKAQSLNQALTSLVQKKLRMPKKTTSKKAKATKSKKVKSAASSASSVVSEGVSSASSAASSAGSGASSVISEGASSASSTAVEGASSASSIVSSAASSGSSVISSAGSVASSAASSAFSDLPKVRTPKIINPDGKKVPSQEEIMEMVRKATGNKVQPEDSHDEL